MTDQIDTSPEAVERLAELLVQADKTKHGYYGYVMFNRDGKRAASALRALAAERDRNAAIAIKALERATLAEEWRDHDKARAEKAEANLEHWRHEVGKLHSKVDRLTAENAALRDVLQDALDAMVSAAEEIAELRATLSKTDIDCPWLSDAIDKSTLALAASQPRKTDTNGG